MHIDMDFVNEFNHKMDDLVAKTTGYLSYEKASVYIEMALSHFSSSYRVEANVADVLAALPHTEVSVMVIPPCIYKMQPQTCPVVYPFRLMVKTRDDDTYAPLLVIHANAFPDVKTIFRAKDMRDVTFHDVTIDGREWKELKTYDIPVGDMSEAMDALNDFYSIDCREVVGWEEATVPGKVPVYALEIEAVRIYERNGQKERFIINDPADRLKRLRMACKKS